MSHTEQHIRHRPLEVAHRGASAVAPENTFAAFDAALELGADGIEFDVRLTRDGRLVVIHDPTLERTARPRGGTVAGASLRALRGLDAGGWFDPRFAGEPIPLLDDVLGRYAGRAPMYVDLKQPAPDGRAERELVRLLRRHAFRGTRVDAVRLQSFSSASLRRLAAAVPGYERLQLFGRFNDTDAVCAELPTVSEYATGVGPSRLATNATLVDAAKALGLSVHPHTVNEAEEMRAFAALGVDTIFTDAPGRLDFALAGPALAGPASSAASTALPVAA